MPTVAALTRDTRGVARMQSCPHYSAMGVKSRGGCWRHIAASVHTVLPGKGHPHSDTTRRSGQGLPVRGTPVELVSSSLPLKGASHAQAARWGGRGCRQRHIHSLGWTVPWEGGRGRV